MKKPIDGSMDNSPLPEKKTPERMLTEELFASLNKEQKTALVDFLIFCKAENTIFVGERRMEEMCSRIDDGISMLVINDIPKEGMSLENFKKKYGTHLCEVVLNIAQQEIKNSGAKQYLAMLLVEMGKDITTMLKGL